MRNFTYTQRRKKKNFFLAPISQLNKRHWIEQKKVSSKKKYPQMNQTNKNEKSEKKINKHDT